MYVSPPSSLAFLLFFLIINFKAIQLSINPRRLSAVSLSESCLQNDALFPPAAGGPKGNFTGFRAWATDAPFSLFMQGSIYGGKSFLKHISHWFCLLLHNLSFASWFSIYLRKSFFIYSFLGCWTAGLCVAEIDLLLSVLARKWQHLCSDIFICKCLYTLISAWRVCVCR